ncbi:MAG: MFS transporter [Actinomycetota bacterium]|nr:MFS transporter [Actinomycetota bacterium]
MQQRGSVGALVVVFALAGFMMAQVVSRMPTLRDQVDASTARLGLALLAVGIGSVLAMPWTARLTSRFGSAVVVGCSATLGMAGWASLAWVNSPTTLTVAMFALGAMVGTWDVAMNVQGNAQERLHRRVLMPRLHAGFSAGTVTGALLGAGSAAAGVPLDLQLPVVSVAGVLSMLWCVRRFAPDAAAPRRTRADRTGREERRRSRLTRVELLLGLLAFSSSLSEGAANDWLALVLVDERGAAESVGALTFAGFNVAMTLGRLGGGALIRRTGRAPVLRLAAATAIAGIGLVALVPFLAAAVVGGVLWGLGVSVVFPATMSAAGEAPGRGAQAIGVVSTIGYTGFLAGAPTIGLVAEQVGLDLALLVVAGVCGLIVVLGGAARERTAPAQSTAARPASSRATGTRNGEQET